MAISLYALLSEKNPQQVRDVLNQVKAAFALLFCLTGRWHLDGQSHPQTKIFELGTESLSFFRRFHISLFMFSIQVGILHVIEQRKCILR